MGLSRSISLFLAIICSLSATPAWAGNEADYDKKLREVQKKIAAVQKSIATRQAQQTGLVAELRQADVDIAAIAPPRHEPSASPSAAM
ncbi:MAG: hypothetical protein AAF420_06925 [Pseudomonadota bacterium]